MNHMPQFLVHRAGRKKPMEMRKPKLERLNARKNIEYEATTSCSGASVFEKAPGLRETRSLDLPPTGNRTSFRIEGSDGEMENIFRILKISGPEYFGIPMEAWEARKVRSSSDLPRCQLYRQKDDGASHHVRFGSGDELQMESSRTNSQSESFRGQEIGDLPSNLENSVRESGGSRIGIKGARPPILAPPPSTLKRYVDDFGSTWDILRSFAPDAEGDSPYLNSGRFISSDDEEEGNIERVRRLGEAGVLSESCSFTTTSNEDDSSSTTTELPSNRSPNGRFRRIISYWEKGELLGRGSFGSVYEGIADGGFFFAVKEVSLLDQGDQGRQSVYQLEQEIALLSQFEHENIVQYYGTDKDDSKLYIFLELVTKGSLLSLYQKYHLRDSQASAYTRQILHGLKYLHDRDVVHRDIKCANMLVDASGSVKLADFGLAKATKLNDVKSCKGTAFWMAPEVVNQSNRGYGLAADIWSLGCTVLEMLTRQLPYHPLEWMSALFRIGRSIPPTIPDSLSQDARDFICQCLQVNPNARPTAALLLDHPFVRRPLLSPSPFASPLHYARRH